MGILLSVAILIVLFSFGILNYYVGLKGWQTLKGIIPFLSKKAYWPVLWLLAYSYIVARFAEKFLPETIVYLLTIIGAYWLGALVYFLLIILLLNLVKLLDKKLGFLPPTLKKSKVSSIIGLIVILAVSGILIYGTWNVHNPKINHYDISIPKQANGLNELHAVAVSDVHLGTIIHKEHLKKMIDMINAQNPDIVFIAGDIIDEDIGPFIKQNMSSEFKRLKPKYGIFFSPGNHEYYGGQLDDIVTNLKGAGINVLKDRYLKVANSFYVVGREDKAISRTGNKFRKDLSDLTGNIDKSLPIILLDHQPSNLGEPASQGVDLQISGHTHRGQMFPFNFVTDKIFEEDWGYLKKDNFQLIVSSGFATWGPPIRVGNRAELVDITIRFSH
jgi:hypothetical protein